MSDLDDEFANPFDESPAETETEAIDTSDDTSTESHEEVDETQGEVEAEQTAPEAQESEESQETDEESKSSEDTKPSEDASNQEWAKWRREQKELRQKEEADRLKQQQEYLSDADTEEELRVRQLEVTQQNLLTQQYQETVSRNEEEIVKDYERVTSDPDTQIFNPKSDQFNTRQFDRMRQAYEAINVVVDPRNPNNIIQVKESFYKFAKEWANDWKQDTRVAEAKAGKTAMRNLSKTEPTGNTVAKPPTKSDPLLELWESDD